MKISHLHLQYWFFKKLLVSLQNRLNKMYSKTSDKYLVIFTKLFPLISYKLQRRKKLLLNPSFRNNIDGNKVDKHCYTTFLKTVSALSRRYD